jgi:16S rRNA (guanine527-N7)-methyltransferase
MLAGAGRHCAAGGAILAMKGADPAAELQDVGPDFAVERVVALSVPGLDEARHLACLTPTTGAAND